MARLLHCGPNADRAGSGHETKPDRTSHLDESRPPGDNLVFLDSRAAWCKFPDRVTRTIGEPASWWREA